MDSSEQMVLENIQSDMRIIQGDIKQTNKNILYLCRHTACVETKLNSIEKIIADNDTRLDIYEDKVNKIDTRVAMVAGIISFLVILISPVIASFVA